MTAHGALHILWECTTDRSSACAAGASRIMRLGWHYIGTVPLCQMAASHTDAHGCVGHVVSYPYSGHPQQRERYHVPGSARGLLGSRPGHPPGGFVGLGSHIEREVIGEAPTFPSVTLGHFKPGELNPHPHPAPP